MIEQLETSETTEKKRCGKGAEEEIQKKNTNEVETNKEEKIELHF